MENSQKKINDLMVEIKKKLCLKEIEFEKKVASNYYFKITDSCNSKGMIRVNEATGYLQEKFNGNWRMISTF